MDYGDRPPRPAKHPRVFSRELGIEVLMVLAGMVACVLIAMATDRPFQLDSVETDPIAPTTYATTVVGPPRVAAPPRTSHHRHR